MTPGATRAIVRLASAIVPRRLRAAWRQEWVAELSYSWQTAGKPRGVQLRWRITARASSALAHALWLRSQDITMDHVLHDTRVALRVLRRQPVLSLVAVLTLALGIGLNTAIFSLVNGVLLRPLPIDHLDRLVVIRESLPDINLLNTPLAPVEVLDLAERRDLFEAVAGFRSSDMTLTGTGEPMRVAAAFTLGDFATVFGIKPHVGRFYAPEASMAGTGTVAPAVISYGLWQQIAGGDRAAIGRALELNGVRYDIVGVLAPGFRYPAKADVWLPFAYTDRWRTNRGSLFMTTIGRVRTGVEDAQLQAGLASEAAEWNRQYHSGGMGKELARTPFVEYLSGPLRQILFVLMGAVALVLLIAAANVASLQLARIFGRAHEVAVRAALGAGRARIARQFLIESLVLSVVGGALGLWVGSLSLRLLRTWPPSEGLPLSTITLDTTVLAFTALVTIVTALLFGCLPALRGSKVAPLRALQGSARTTSMGPRARRFLQAGVVAQTALTLVLLLGSGLMIRTLGRLLASDPGFNPEHLVSAHVSLPQAHYNPARAVTFFDSLLERVRAFPGVDAALVFGLPFAGGLDSSPFEVIGRPRLPTEPARHAEAAMVSSNYFRTMGIPVLRGRDFDGTESAGSPVVTLIDETFADQFFPGEDPVGREIRGYFGSATTIIGVVGKVDHDEIGDAPKAVSYYSYRQQPWLMTRAVVVRSTQSPEAVTAMLRESVRDLDPRVPLYDVQTMSARIERSLGPRRLAMLALGVFSGMSMLLATIGIYGVMSYSSAQRTREIGIRVALGAPPWTMVALVGRQGLAFAALGIGLGAALGLAATRLMRGMLFEVSPYDPATFAIGAAVLGIVVLAASLFPALRASRVDPVRALRVE